MVSRMNGGYLNRSRRYLMGQTGFEKKYLTSDSGKQPVSIVTTIASYKLSASAVNCVVLSLVTDINKKVTIRYRLGLVTTLLDLVGFKLKYVV